MQPRNVSTIASSLRIRLSSMAIPFSRPRTSSTYGILGMMVSGETFRAPRGPIVLCHGLYGFDKMGPSSMPSLQIHYWRNIADALKDIGATVFVTKVSRVADLATRASELKHQLDQNTQGRELNLMGHSMGGLDCRYMISHLNPSLFRVHSLTTISTPHRGSPFMDWCRDTLGVGNIKGNDIDVDHHAPSFQSADSVSPPTSRHPLIRSLLSAIDRPAYSNLTTTYCNSVLNPTTPDDPNVKYFSYGASIDIALLHPLRFPYEVIKRVEGENDGLVSVRSAKWGTYLGTLKCDHWDLNNRWKPISELSGLVEYYRKGEKDSLKDFDAIGLYLKTATRLADEGF